MEIFLVNENSLTNTLEAKNKELTYKPHEGIGRYDVVLSCIRCGSKHMIRKCSNCGGTQTSWDFQFSQKNMVYCNDCEMGITNFTCQSCETTNPVGPKTLTYIAEKSSLGCFITTATTVAIGKGDSSLELNSFRDFRDNWLLKQPNGKEIVEDYYSIAPKIVEKIEQLPNSTSIYKSIWKDDLEKAFNLIQNREFQKAKEIYKTMVNRLKIQFI